MKLQGAVTEQGALIAVLTTTASTTGHSWIFSFYTSNKRSANDSAKPLTKKKSAEGPAKKEKLIHVQVSEEQDDIIQKNPDNVQTTVAQQPV